VNFTTPVDWVTVASLNLPAGKYVITATAVMAAFGRKVIATCTPQVTDNTDTGESQAMLDPQPGFEDQTTITTAGVADLNAPARVDFACLENPFEQLPPGSILGHAFSARLVATRVGAISRQ
jgi:hypothetical protein